MKKLLSLKNVKKLNNKEMSAIQGGLACHPDWAPCPGTHLRCVNSFCEPK